MRTLLFSLLVFVTGTTLVLGQDGKVRGKVRDKESGEPLIGATVFIEGTARGASTDLRGEYVILGVPAGSFMVKASYVGYTPLVMSNVIVNSNLTTTQDFSLSSRVIQLATVEVLAQKPLIQRNTTNTIRVAVAEDLHDLAARDFQSIVALQAGVVRQDGTLYIRGGRAGEVAYFIDGANTTNPFTNTQNVNVVREAIQELQVETGGFTAEQGGAMSGIVRTTLKTGGTDLKGSLDYQTDDFAKPGNEFLGTTALGYRNAVATLGGPVPGISNVRLFLIGQYNYLRNRQSIFLEPFSFNFVTDYFGTHLPNTPLPGPVEFKRNYLYNNYLLTKTLQGTLVYTESPFKVHLSGSYEFSENPVGNGWPGILGRSSAKIPANYFRQARAPLAETKQQFWNLRVLHLLSPTTFYEVGLSYQQRAFRQYDKDFGNNWMAYPDSVANDTLGYKGWVGRYQGPNPYSVVFNFLFADPFAPNNTFSKDVERSFSGSVNLTSQINPRWELKLGGRVERWVIRSYSISDIAGYLVLNDANKDGVPDTGQFANDDIRIVKSIDAGEINNIGYDYLGNETDNGVDAPGRPLLASAYVQNKFEFNDLILNFGLRYEFFDPQGTGFEKTVNPITNELDYNEPNIDQSTNLLRDASLIKTEPFGLVLPRISFSFPVTDRTVFYAQFGKYAQMASLNQLYQSNYNLSRDVSPSTRENLATRGVRVGFMMRPERTTSYEFGLRQLLTDNFALTLTGFYRDIRDQLGVQQVYNSAGIPIFFALLNEDFSTTKGVELTLNLRRTNRLAASVNYTLSDASGTASRSNHLLFGLLSREAFYQTFQHFINPLDFNQGHRGSILLDYRFPQGDGGPILEGMGISLLLTFNSGHPFIRRQEPRNLGQATAWNVGTESALSSPLTEPLNSSTTPWVFNMDLVVTKVFYLGSFNLELYMRALNLLNSKPIINVYPTTGSPYDDGWLKSPLANGYKGIPQYVDFYRAINSNNRWAYMNSGGKDLYGAPRQIILGMRLEI